MEAYARFTAWVDYLSGMLSVAEIDEREAERSLSQQEAMTLLGIEPVKGEQVYRAKARNTLDRGVQEHADAVDQAHAYRKLLGVLYGNAERDMALISRELTRRVGGMQSSRTDRGARWNR